MDIILPVAGLGTRLRPQTWSKPKPLIHLAGRTVLDYVLDQFASLPNFKNAEFILIMGANQDHRNVKLPFFDVRNFKVPYFFWPACADCKSQNQHHSHTAP